MTQDKPTTIKVKTRAPKLYEVELRKAYAMSVVEQSKLMDGVAQQLLLIELAIPGLYATALQLTQGENATLTMGGWVIVAFLCWTLSLLLTLRALFPRDWSVDPDKLDSDRLGKSKQIGIKNFFRESAVYKRRWLVRSIALFFVGILAAVVSIVM